MIRCQVKFNKLHRQSIMIEIEKDLNEELRLAQRLKDNYCNESGKEDDTTKAAELIHQIGLIYRKRSPDKMSLVKSAGLFNAAIVRNPPNVSQIKSDLAEICQHILQIANAEILNADLIEKADEVKAFAIKLRNEVEAFLKTKVPQIPINAKKEDFEKLKLQKTSAIQKINALIAEKYKLIMSELSQYCEKVMGKPPCEYAIVGMGSLARKEITPYSDFEHIILLCDGTNCKSYIDYFRWFSVIFQIVILNLKETIIPSLNIWSLNGKDFRLKNWYYDAITPRGICFDGMMPHACKFPLGRQQHTKEKHFSTELIKPVSEMLEYLTSEADLKNGYHLADILTKTCFVFGTFDIFKQFAEGSRKFIEEKSLTDIANDVQQQVKNNLNSFSTRFRLTELKSQGTINIKQLVYRSTTIFIAALARILKLSSDSSFEIIDEMAKNNHITQNTAIKLSCGIAIACEMRLRVYMENKSQNDNAIDLKKDGIEKFLNIVGVASTINYFQIAYCLQCEVAKRLNFTKLHFYSDSLLVNITIGLAFGMGDLAHFSEDPKNRLWNSSKFDFDTCIKQLETEIALKSSILENPAHKFSLNVEQIKSLANHLCSVEIYDEALEFYKQLLTIYEQKSMQVDFNADIAWANNQIGACLYSLKQPENALNYLNRALVCRKKLTSNEDRDRDVATTLNNIGSCHISLKQYTNALINLKRALEIKQNTSVKPLNDMDIASTLHNIGCCHINLLQFDYALIYLHRALKIKQNNTLNVDNDRSIAATIHRIGSCHIDMRQYNEGLNYLNEALKVYQNVTLEADTDRSIAATHHEIGCCHIELSQYEHAIKHLNQALEIKQKKTLNVDTDSDIAVTLHRVGSCYTGLHQYDKALEYLERALEIKQHVKSDAASDREIATTLHEIGRCHVKMNQFDRALKHLNKALEIDQKASTNVDQDHDLAVTKSVVGRCLTGLQQYTASWNYLQQSMQIFRNITQDERKDPYIAGTYNYMGECLMGKQHHQEALKHFRRALKIYDSSPNHADNNTSRAKTLRNIGLCQMKC